MALWTPRLAKVRIPGVTRGAGWAIGTTGLVTALDAATPSTSQPVEVVVGAAPDRAFTVEPVWQDATLGLAIMQVSAADDEAWRDLMEREPSPVLASPWSDVVPEVTAMGFAQSAVGLDEESSISWMLSQPLEILGELRPGILRGDRAIFESRTARGSRGQLRHLLPGAVVLRYRPEPMVIGLVTRRARGLRNPHLEVSTFPDPLDNSDFRSALCRVGARPIVHSMDGPILRQHLRPHSVDVSGRAMRVRAVTDDTWFGTHPTRRGAIAGHTDAHLPSIGRPEQAALTAALDAALAGDGQRVIVVRGPARSGKSRLVADTVRQHPRLQDHQLLAPRPGSTVESLPERVRSGPVLVWLDAIEQYPVTTLDRFSVRRFLRANTQALYIATTSEPPPTHDEALNAAVASLSGVAAVLADRRLTSLIDISSDPEWVVPLAADEEPPGGAAASEQAAAALTAARGAGQSLGEYLAATRDLAEHYRLLPESARVLVDIVTEWDSSGAGEPIPESAARSLWMRSAPARLPRTDARRFARLSDAQAADEWRDAVQAATESVAGTTGLVSSSPAGLTTTRAAWHRDDAPISSLVWDYLLKQHPSTAAARLTMGVEALRAGTLQRALRAFESILFFRDDADDDAHGTLIEVTARRGIALYLTQLGQWERAVSVYTDAIDAFSEVDDRATQGQLAEAIVAVAQAFRAMGSDGQAVSAAIELDTRFAADDDELIRLQVATGLLLRAEALTALERPAEAQACVAEIVKRYGADDSPWLADIVDRARESSTPSS